MGIFRRCIYGGRGGLWPRAGGSIPLEALRVGADAFASDLNPIPVLLNKVVLEYIPKYGQRIGDEVRRWGQWIKDEAEKELASYYPKDRNGSTPIAYLWARTVLSEAPVKDEIPVEVPLMRSLWLAKKSNRRRALRWVRDDNGKVKTQTLEVFFVEDGQRIARKVKRPVLEIFEPTKESDVEGGTVARGSATCPVTGFTTKVDRVRAQLKSRRGGAADARLFCVVTTRESEQGRFYRLPTKADQEAFDAAAVELERREKEDGTQRSQKGRKDGEGIAAGQGTRRSLVPDEVISLNELRRVSVPIYGMERWGDLFSPRQALALTTLAQLVREAGERLKRGETVPNQGEKGQIAGTKTLSAGMGEASAARRTGIPTASDRGSSVFSGLTTNSERDQADHDLGAKTGLADAVTTCLAFSFSRIVDQMSSLVPWASSIEVVKSTFGRQALGMCWDFVEPQVFGGSGGDFLGAIAWVAKVCAECARSVAHPEARAALRELGLDDHVEGP